MKHLYTDATLETVHGRFVIRVYTDAFGKETVVLYSEQLNPSDTVLVRVHSECFTGDTLESLMCDCREQLHRALELIHQDGNGVLIHLRQEGRGIGLFEKIRSYQLQQKGIDTYEANVMLGHLPDERTYEWAKIALTDLQVSRIRLLTNNPAKVSEIEKLGITVLERVPLVIAANQFDQEYLATKRDKFKHFL
jgi:GTP cyclohydrolase II